MRADKVRQVADQAALRDQRALRITTVCLGIFAVMLGVVFEKQNVAFMVMLAFAVACSATFPVLFMSVLWKDCTTRGAVWGGTFGLISSVALTVMSPAVWEASFGNPKGSALYPYVESTGDTFLSPHIVIPAHAGIQPAAQLDTGFRRCDGFHHLG